MRRNDALTQTANFQYHKRNHRMCIQKTLRCAVYSVWLLLLSAIFIGNTHAQTPDEPTIAFATDVRKGVGIWFMTPEGENPRLVLEVGEDSLPSGLTWSFNGKQIAFHAELEGNIDVYVVDADGENLRRRTDHPGEDSWTAWHPEGERLAFSTNRDGNFEIYAMTSAGEALENITNDSVQDQYPSWSPDGRTIAFASKRGKTLGDIFVMDARGENVRNLTNVRGEDIQPKWSRDGNRIAWTSRRNGAGEIWSMEADGANPMKISDLQDPRAPGVRNRDVTWAPDGGRIASTAFGQGGVINIRIHPSDGNLEWQDLPAVGSEDRSPAWFDPAFVGAFSVSAAEKQPLTWGWLKLAGR